MTSPSEPLRVETKVINKYNIGLRWFKYLLLGAICNGDVWGVSLSYLKKNKLT
mgnify:CR=1 FL=1